MNMSTWAIRNPVPPIALFLVLMVMGLFSFNSLAVTRMPNVDLPVISIHTALAGSGPSEIVTQIVTPIEDELANVQGVRHISSTANDGAARLTVEFEINVDSDRALNDVKDAVAAARSDLPDAATEPVVRRVEVMGGSILTYAASGASSTIEELSTFVDDVVAPALQGAKGVGSVDRIGGAEREIAVDLRPDRMLAHGLTTSDVNSQLRAQNMDAGGGEGRLAGQQIAIRALGSATSLAQLGATRISLPAGGTVRLDQIAAISDGAADRESFALLNGRPVVAFGIFRASGESDLLAAENARAELDRIAAEYPDITFTQIDDATTYTKSNYDTAIMTLLEGAALTILVVMLFLRDWRATVVTLVALPLSIIPTFFVMQMLGFTLNTISLLAITLVVGILVDDAIVEIENIVRHIQMGRNAYDAAVEAASEIGTTVIAISLTIVAVFAPVGVMPGIAGKFFREFGLTVAVAVLFSLLVARLVTPMFAAYFMRAGSGHTEAKDGPVMRRYLRVLRWTLRHRLITLLIGLAIFAGSIYSATLLPQEFVPPSDSGRATITVELPPGATMSETEAATRRITALVSEVPEMQSIFVEGTSDTEATIRVNFGSREDRERPGPEITAEIEERLKDVPDTRIYVLNEEGVRDVQINILAGTQSAAEEAARTLASAMGGIGQLRDVAVESALPRPEVQIIPRPQLAAELGVDASTIASTVRLATVGDSDANLAQFDAGEEQVPVRVRVEEAARDDLMRLEGLRLRTSSGQMIPLGVVTDVTLATGPSQIERYDREYKVTVGATLARGAFLGDATNAIDALPAAQEMPAGARIQAAGDAETMAEIFGGFAVAMAAGVMLVYVVLTLLFHSFVTPVTIILSLPLAIGGAIFALYLYGAGIGLSVVIGFLMLMGIVTKNAIMLVEFALEAAHRGLSRAEAMIDAAHKRARPIIMTTIAMTAGMVPSALAHGEGGEIRAPMAVAVIGGLLLSTLLSLLLVPSLYDVIEGGKDRARRMLGHIFGGAPAGPAEARPGR
ncbi:efflux RND transporter permease subunit [Sagittula salina]|uniref:Efflux RND transporter permease subunit n=1 Tax=Sagittula salina TaxID=2820268 RepID=A0A940MN83_9RHOB|nr:efflux RND transporter permease subunit [Sagittula salina]MBP0482668.1 efflux RND transporter permease subunit [Sagittula salina]